MSFTAAQTGTPLPDWEGAPSPKALERRGRFVEIAPLSVAHAAELYAAVQHDPELWTYMANGPFADEASFTQWVETASQSSDPLFHALRPVGGSWSGVAAYMRITPKDGVIEIGSILYARALQGSPAATEAMALLMEAAFDMGYRRYEWKCNALNISSRRAAQRLGFSYEGTFRQHMVVKGLNRDTAWFSILDSEWPALREAYAEWLAPSNFDGSGAQKRALSALTAPLLQSRDPAL